MAGAEPDWRPTVRIAPAVELARRWNADGPREPTVGVRELLDLRTAYFRRVHPLPFTPEQEARLASGRELHAELGARLAAGPAELEVRLRRDGLVGQIDWRSDVPVELKTTGTVPQVGSIGSSRPEYLEQLGMYCAMAGTAHGRLLVVPASGRPVEAAVALDVQFADPEAIWAEMLRRAGRLRDAVRSGDPGTLPRCAWFARGCSYREAGLCPCTGDELPLGPAASDRVVALRPDQPSTEAVQHALGEVNALPPPFPDRFTDLIYPRRAYFRLTGVPPPATAARWVRSDERDRLYRRIVEHVESTDPAGQGRRMPTHGGVREPVPLMHGQPYLIKITRAAPRPSSEAMLAAQSQYFLELGLRCQSVGAAQGWLVVGYERAAPDVPPIAVLEVRFDPLDRMERFAAAREAALRDAVARRAPAALVPCPEWMYRDCPYRDACACGAEGSPNR